MAPYMWGFPCYISGCWEWILKSPMVILQIPASRYKCHSSYFCSRAPQGIASHRNSL